MSRMYAVFDPEEAARLRAVGTPLAEFCVDIQGQVNQFALEITHLPGFDLPDPITMAVALDPTVASLTRSLFVQIETSSELCRGQTVVDHLGITGKSPNAKVVLEASRDKFLSVLYGAV